MIDALREAVKAAVRKAHDMPHLVVYNAEADAAIRAVLTYYAENGPTEEMVNARLAIRFQSIENGFKAMMRAALAERGK